MGVAVEELNAKSARAAIPELAAVLADCVAGGASVGFMEGFGLAEHNLRFGHLDAVVPRPEQRAYLARLLRLFGA